MLKDGDLILGDRKMLPSKRKAMLDELSKNIPKMVRVGFKVLVDELDL
ncbi:hypothetical protein KKI90_04270 [Xenorhabdus bovienii]|nr:hypothetical protein [Xenorhabdus bovienii]MDE1485628.1 hypothetical protein [Xenorhabdus bovienii]MDE1495816.1 hypothetical protein [Xenorhabdus bovienii]MDE9473822.1 hypothetical protein [Xenorhabdus bovienii]MDE9476331.1 hypothetical protein [Xenorhabdus bovienii]